MSQKMTLWLVCLMLSLVGLWWYTVLAATNMTNENLIAELTNWSTKSTTRWYNLSDKDKISFVSLNGNTLILSAPLAQRDGKVVSSYYISRWPVSYKEIMSTSNGIEKLHDSKEYKNLNNKQMYEIKDNKLFLTFVLDDITADLYITIAPESDDGIEQWTTIEDYKINPASQAWSTTKVLAENFSNSSLNKAISDVSCIWTKDQNRVNLTWSVNTALNATKVQIYNRPNESQGTMDLKGSPDIDDKSFTLTTSHREIQLFRLKPVDSNGTMVGEEIQYICKPDVESTTTVDGTGDNNPIPVTPHTGPKETLAFILFISALAYAVYRKTRRA